MDAKMTARTQYLPAHRTGFVLDHTHRNISQTPDLSKKSQDITAAQKQAPENFNNLQESSEVRETSTAKEDMRSLLALLILTLALAALCCCEKDPKEPSGSLSADSIKIKKEVANAFVKRKKRASPYEWYLEYYKSPMEQMHERCENYPPCDYLSDQVGFALAYNRFFGRY